jgi:thiamine-phosphate pyrophosphorylase
VILPTPPLLVITDRRQARGTLEDALTAVLAGGGRWISLREKDLSAPDRAALLARLVALARPHGAIVMVHEDLDAALQAGADGVHLPSGGDPAFARRRLGAGALIGLSAHSAAEIQAASRSGADYVTVSPIFASASKPGYGPVLGLTTLASLARGVALPVIALGGVTEASAAECRAAGAAGIAVMGHVMRAADPGAITARLIAALQRTPKSSDPPRTRPAG